MRAILFSLILSIFLISCGKATIDKTEETTTQTGQVETESGIQSEINLIDSITDEDLNNIINEVLHDDSLTK